MEKLEQEVFKYKKMAEREVDIFHRIVSELIVEHEKETAKLWGDILSLHDTTNKLQAQLYDVQNQNCEYENRNPPNSLPEGEIDAIVTVIELDIISITIIIISTIITAVSTAGHPEDWLLDYSTAVGIAKGNKRWAMRYSPLMLLGSARTWLNNLPAGSINGWLDFEDAFVSNFIGTYRRPGQPQQLEMCKQARTRRIART
ncbi:hypothetical protein QYE76_069974 [Lolium multiflorum]|uniref:Retrotransposon gag domain-containing protein n=1 Tax=Lolium multiflorum TaxID=4521 RepID=A0AAD8SI24_LOLMU|nr:hypothetical protein QYE76_069974 [Lolium multiflorum]